MWFFPYHTELFFFLFIRRLHDISFPSQELATFLFDMARSFLPIRYNKLSNQERRKTRMKKLMNYLQKVMNFYAVYFNHAYRLS